MRRRILLLLALPLFVLGTFVMPSAVQPAAACDGCYGPGGGGYWHKHYTQVWTCYQRIRVSNICVSSGYVTKVTYHWHA